MVFTVQELFYDTIANPLMDIVTILNTTIKRSITTNLEPMSSLDSEYPILSLIPNLLHSYNARELSWKFT